SWLTPCSARSTRIALPSASRSRVLGFVDGTGRSLLPLEVAFQILDGGESITEGGTGLMREGGALRAAHVPRRLAARERPVAFPRAGAPAAAGCSRGRRAPALSLRRSAARLPRAALRRRAPAR